MFECLPFLACSDAILGFFYFVFLWGRVVCLFSFVLRWSSPEAKPAMAELTSGCFLGGCLVISPRIEAKNS